MSKKYINYQDETKHTLENVKNIPPVSASLPELEKKIKSLEFDPGYVAIDLKARFAEAVLQTMKKQGMNKNDLAEKLGKSRQYIGRVLNENANFTIETMAEIAAALEMKLTIEMNSPKNKKTSVMPENTSGIKALPMIKSVSTKI